MRIKKGNMKMSALINYTTLVFTTEFEMNEMINHIDNTSKVWAPEMKKRGLKRFVCTRILNISSTNELTSGCSDHLCTSNGRECS